MSFNLELIQRICRLEEQNANFDPGEETVGPLLGEFDIEGNEHSQ